MMAARFSELSGETPSSSSGKNPFDLNESPAAVKIGVGRNISAADLGTISGPRPLSERQSSGPAAPFKVSGSVSKYSTSFPDPFGDLEPRSDVSDSQPATPAPPLRQPGERGALSLGGRGQHAPSSRSNSVTFALGDSNSSSPMVSSRASQFGRLTRHPPWAQQTGSVETSAQQGSSRFTSFLSRATSVTSGSVGDRIGGSVRSAVDSLSSLNERLLGGSGGQDSPAGQPEQLDAQLPLTPTGTTEGQAISSAWSASSYIASKISSATNQLTGGVGGSGGGGVLGATTGSGLAAGFVGSGGLSPSISRQRVVLVIDQLTRISATNSNSGQSIDWPQQFAKFRATGGWPDASGSTDENQQPQQQQQQQQQQPQQQASSSVASNALSSFFAGAANLGGVVGVGGGGGGAGSGGQPADLVEQADFRDISVLANQNSGSATIIISGQTALLSDGNSYTGSGHRQRTQQVASTTTISGPKLVRPEYVVVRQRALGEPQLDRRLAEIVRALDYCLVPMFEPADVWVLFQERQQVMGRLLRVQRRLGKESFPLIPQLSCQTHLDLLNYVLHQASKGSANRTSHSSIPMPCLVRLGPLGKAKIRTTSLEDLRDVVEVLRVSQTGCSLEQHLNVKTELLVQKMGGQLRLLRRNRLPATPKSASTTATTAELQALELAPSPKQTSMTNSSDPNNNESPLVGAKQSISQQISLGTSSVLAQILPGKSSGVTGSSLLSRAASNPCHGWPNNSQQHQHLLQSNSATGSWSLSPNWGNFERATGDGVPTRYRKWVDAIADEFGPGLKVFCLKILVDSSDREYIVGLENSSSMQIRGASEIHQDEDRRQLVRLVAEHMDSILPANQSQQQRYQQLHQLPSVDQKSANETSSNSSSINKTRLFSTSQGQMGHLGASYGRTNATIADGGRNGRPGFVGGLASRSQSVSMGVAGQMSADRSSAPKSADEASLTPLSYLIRRSSDRSDSLGGGCNLSLEGTLNDSFVSDLSSLAAPSSSSNMDPSVGSSSGGGRPLPAYSSLLDQTSTAFSSFQRQSMNFFKRLDSLAGSNTPPSSAQSDKAFDRAYVLAGGPSAEVLLTSGCDQTDQQALSQQHYLQQHQNTSQHHNLHNNQLHQARKRPPSNRSPNDGFKSQSVDGTAGSGSDPNRWQNPLRREPGAQSTPRPPKPPPPQFGATVRQSSLASTDQRRPAPSCVTPNSSPVRTLQNSGLTGSLTEDLATGAKLATVISSSPTLSGSTDNNNINNGRNNNNNATKPARVVRQNSALSAFEPFDPDLAAQSRCERELAALGDQSPLPVAATSGTKSLDEQQQPLAGNQAANIRNKTGPSSDSASITSAESAGSGNAEDTMNNLKKTFASIFGDKCE